MPTQVMAQSCSWSAGPTCTFSAGSYSTSLYQAGGNGTAFTVTVDPGAAVTVDLANSGGISSQIPPVTILNNAPVGTNSGPTGTDALGLTINNSGSLILQNSTSLWAPNAFLGGLYSWMSGGQGYNGSTPGNGGSTSQPLSVNNFGSITVFLPYTELQFGSAVYAMSQGGNGGCNNLDSNNNCSISGSSEGGQGGNSAGTIINNSGTINVTVGTQYQFGGGHAGFGGIEALSFGGNAGYGNNGTYGGSSAASKVINSAPVTVNFNWTSDNYNSTGLYGILAQSQGGNGTGTKGGDGSNWGGWGGSVNGASVTLNSGGDVTVIQTGTPPGQGIAWNFFASAPNNEISSTNETVPAFLAKVTGAGVAAVAIGGNGGNSEEENYSAGGGGYVLGSPTIGVTDATVKTTGNNLPALLAWSQGGNGGLGATENDGNQSGSAYSNGGPGGIVAGSTVNVTAGARNVLISTSGDSSPAISAFALGGNGGDTNPVAHDDGHNTDASAGAGGSVCADAGFTGSCHGAAPTSITLTGTNGHTVQLKTNGVTAPGIYAVSEGGKGGYGGDFAPSGSHGQGYNGGAGGSGSDVTVALYSATINTGGPTSPGIIALSQGGVGGYGGFGDGGCCQNDGGKGGAGGATGNVTVSLDAPSSITTLGIDSSGIIAQTVSGAGGAGGDQQGHHGTGGLGGPGGAAGAVAITNWGGITTNGDASRGILAQSMSGAGGTGGNADAFFSGVGGDGASSGSAGIVTVTNNGSVTTRGTDAQGILAQSIGGGGGAGGSASGLAAMGGSGALPGKGNSVIIYSQNGSITTSGLSSAGVLGQSIGGGGGDGGLASGAEVTIGGVGGGGGDGGAVTFSSGNGSGSTITTNGDYSPAVLMQSIGGGGGNGGNSSNEGLFASVAIGGHAGNGGNAGPVVVHTNQTNITTFGTKSPGIVAQSIGGGGGMGGNAFAGSVGVGFSAAVAVGGSGGPGGDGNDVWVNVTRETIATGQNPLLINDTRDTYGKGQYLPNSCTALPCNVLPVDSYGVVVQSIGGGGGLGGSAVAKAIALATPNIPDDPVSIAVALSASVGGTGGVGGKGGPAQFQLSDGGVITTSGQGATAVLLQSIGGGGGAGGDSSALSAAVGYGPAQPSSSVDLTYSISLGGNGGNGNSGGPVVAAIGGTIENATSSNAIPKQDASGLAPTSIITYGDFADGVKAQSIGGGGGDAGTGSSNTQFFGSAYTPSLSMTLGSTGGSGGAGGSVNVALYPNSSITTYGSNAIGILAQSIGGGGGASQGGSFNIGFGAKIPGDPNSVRLSAGVNVGTTGGDGNTGGAVTVVAEAPITTNGGDAVGILAQSVGGGGGVAGSTGSDASADNPVIRALAVNEGLSNVASLIQNGFAGTGTSFDGTATVSVGGKGGSGGTGGNVDIELSAPISTKGDWASGIVAQSIGGGGGMGGAAYASGTGGLPEVTLNADVAVGGAGGTGNDAGSVTINLNQGNTKITTSGYGAAGIAAQSIGGGGGIGADGSDSSTGLRSVGGASGGNGGVGGNGGTVTVNNQNPNGTTILTTGDVADGVALQSIGGGGGVAGAGSSLFAGTTRWGQSGTLTLSAGGGSAASGQGGSVTFNSGSNPIMISTMGNDAFGIVAQSIGGGGGSVISQPTSNSTISTQIGGGSANGDSVKVALSNGSTITTTGIAAHGIVAQSIGGGGGVIRVVNAVGDTPGLTTWMGNLASGSTYKTSGNGGNVTVEANGNITVSGAGAIGIFAQSVGGGGGLVMNGNSIQAGTPGLFVGGGSSGSGGAVSVTTSGPISATGQNGIGIFAQSTGPSGSPNGSITVTVSSSVTGGSGSGATDKTPGSAAVVVDSGGAGSVAGQVTVNEGGSLTTEAGTAGTSILGYANVTNNGIVTGAAYLSGGEMNNSGTYNAGATMDGNLVNSGTTNVGVPGSRSLQTTTVTGNFTQTDTGKLGVTVDFLNKATSQLHVNGSASVNGLITPTALTLLPGALPVVTATNLNSSVRGLSSLLFDWHVDRSDDHTLVLSPSPHFKPGGVPLTASEASLVDYLIRAWNNSDALFATHFAALSRLNDVGQYRAVLDAFSGKTMHGQTVAYLETAGQVLGSAMSCPVFADRGVLLGEDNCVWTKATAQRSQLWGSTDTQDSHVNSAVYRIGGQHQIAPDWYLGGAFGFGQTWLRADDGASGSGKTYDGSIGLKHTVGPWLFAGSIAVGRGLFHNERQISLPFIDTNMSLEGDPSIFFIGARFRVGYEFVFDNWYVRPYGDLDLIYTHLPEFRESGPIPLALNIRGRDKTNIVLSPMIEFGGRWTWDEKTTLRPFATLGMSYWPNNARAIDASFVGSSPANGSFRSYLASPGVQGIFNLGMQLYRGNGFDVKLEYGLAISSAALTQSGSVRFAYHF
ncbi:autotransporter outer membrane beta-barrel domain-containing protein [Burkholderia sp. Bp8986]|uniref:autotransporter outer membrane beta-barrel domain-containing protein n=1 Tax=Burkholderia sp. Bp8986 TaxID=2184550 RepID=UPI000F594C83|nr:autotransporter outer membrane beta-barrel domain-containing protein [Burkholderia sp. Bp8986]